jgi:hypothetical protein
MVLGIDGELNIVTDNVGPLAAARHSARVRIAQRDLPAGRGFDPVRENWK